MRINFCARSVTSNFPKSQARELRSSCLGTCRGWKYQTLTAWIVVPINYFWRPEYDVNWARGPFFHEQHVVPGLIYLLAYLLVVPITVYFPTHLMLARWARQWR